MYSPCSLPFTSDCSLPFHLPDRFLHREYVFHFDQIQISISQVEIQIQFIKFLFMGCVVNFNLRTL